jgi:hypothetical protein
MKQNSCEELKDHILTRLNNNWMLFVGDQREIVNVITSVEKDEKDFEAEKISDAGVFLIKKAPGFMLDIKEDITENECNNLVMIDIANNANGAIEYIYYIDGDIKEDVKIEKIQVTKENIADIISKDVWEEFQFMEKHRKQKGEQNDREIEK